MSSLRIGRFLVPSNAPQSCVVVLVLRNCPRSCTFAHSHQFFFLSDRAAYFWQYWNVERQFRFIEKDLASVDRTKTPFVITMAHRPMYCSDSDDHDDCTKVNSTMRRGLLGSDAHDGLFALEPLFKKYNVDIAFWAHEHTYERFWPMYEGVVVNSTNDSSDPYHNPAATVHIVAGASGGREGHDKFEKGGRTGSAVQDIRYGYGRLRIENATHLYWEEIEDSTGAAIDSFWIRKDLEVGRDSRQARGQEGS